MDEGVRIRRALYELKAAIRAIEEATKTSTSQHETYRLESIHHHISEAAEQLIPLSIEAAAQASASFGGPAPTLSGA